MIPHNRLKQWLVISLLGLALLLGAAVSYAQSEEQPAPVVLTDGPQQFALGRYLELYEDPTGQLTIAEVSAPEFAARFTPSTVEKLRQLTRGALAEMRSLLLELRPAALLEARLENMLT